VAHAVDDRRLARRPADASENLAGEWFPARVDKLGADALESAAVWGEAAAGGDVADHVAVGGARPSKAVNHADRSGWPDSSVNGTKQYQHRQLQIAFWKTWALIRADDASPSAAAAGAAGSGFAGQPGLVTVSKWRTRP
jgi:hypothetical protein